MATDCLCCRQRIDAPSLDEACARLSPVEACILRTVWAGNGMPVPTSKIFDALYCEDQDGGPSDTTARRHLTSLIQEMNEMLDGCGVLVLWDRSRSRQKGVRLRIRTT